jgi:hypothetical protein
VKKTDTAIALNDSDVFIDVLIADGERWYAAGIISQK